MSKPKPTDIEKRVSAVGSTIAQSSETLLEVSDLTTYFRSSRGLVRAVDGVSFKLDRGKTLGIVVNLDRVKPCSPVQLWDCCPDQG